MRIAKLILAPACAAAILLATYAAAYAGVRAHAATHTGGQNYRALTWSFDVECYGSGACGGADEPAIFGPLATANEAMIRSSDSNCGPVAFELQIYDEHTAVGRLVDDVTSAPIAPGASAVVSLAKAAGPGELHLKLSVPGGETCNPHTDSLKGTVTIKQACSPSQPSASLDMVPTRAVRVGSRVHYSGCGWSPRGPRIAILWDGRRVATHPAARSISGSFTVPDFATRTLSTCKGVASARQGGASRSVTVTGTPGSYVYVGRDVTLAGRAVDDGSVLCAGSRPKLGHRHVLASTPLHPSFSEPAGITIEDAPADIDVSGVRFGGTRRITLALGGGRHVTFSSRAGIGPDVADLATVDDAGNSLTLDLAGPLCAAGAQPAFNTFYYVNEDLTAPASCSLTFQNGYVFVVRTVSFAGPVSGEGALIAAGTLTLRGHVHLSPHAEPDGSHSLSLVGWSGLTLG